MSDDVDVTRRTLLTAAALGTAALSLPHTSRAQVATAAAATGGAPVAPVATGLKPLSFDPAKLVGISERLIRSHWENNYGGSVKALAVVKQKLTEAAAAKDTPPYVYNDLKREHLMRTGSVVYHELYFDSLGGDGRAGAAARSAIAATFGSFDAWEVEFRRIGAGLAGGSGWVLLGHNAHTGQLENYWLADHAHGPAATLPVLVMDMYEHSYQMDYGAAAGKYIDAFFRNLNWDVVSARLEAAATAKAMA